MAQRSPRAAHNATEQHVEDYADQEIAICVDEKLRVIHIVRK